MQKLLKRVIKTQEKNILFSSNFQTNLPDEQMLLLEQTAQSCSLLVCFIIHKILVIYCVQNLPQRVKYSRYKCVFDIFVN